VITVASAIDDIPVPLRFTGISISRENFSRSALHHLSRFDTRHQVSFEPATGQGYTIIGKGHQGVVATLVERKTQYTVLVASKTRQAPLVRQCTEQVTGSP